MRALPKPRHWHDASGVVPCRECDGEGSRPNRPHLHPADPDCWPVDCPVCDGQGHHPCAVCGFDHIVPGYDCLVCDFTRELTPAQLRAINPADIADAFAAAVNVALNAEARS